MLNWDYQHPYFFLLLLPILLYAVLKLLALKKTQALGVPSIKGFQTKDSLYKLGFYFLVLLRVLLLSALVFALARPRVPLKNNVDNNKLGIDIIMVVDVSLSMLSKDLQPDRLSALKNVALQFIYERPNDRIGLLVYSGEALTKVPLTSDKEILENEIGSLNPYELESGTAIGVGLATAVNHLKDSKAKSKIIILLTDGENNKGEISPETAADIAKAKNVKVYTIGIGKEGMVLSPTGRSFFDNELEFRLMPSNLDVELLKNIAHKTGGKFFRATSNELLKNIYKEINQLEKSKINNESFINYFEKYRFFLFLALFFLAMEIILRSTIYKSIFH